MECYYSRYNEEEITLLLQEAKRHHLLVSGGSDYHGANKNIPLGTLNNFGEEVKIEQLTLLDNLLK
jgi:predicted metal-dependent phosphoesterase TrpH